MKRKRSLSEEECFSMAFGFHDSKDHRNFGSLFSPVSPLDIKLNNVADGMDPMLESNIIANTVESQFNLEILLKHNELRLIDQELAKCQVALEQLRRCHLIPYPGHVESPEARLNITNGIYSSRKDSKTARWAPPFGLTNGPYSRHYAKWLIPDPCFDSIVWQDVNTLDAAKSISIAQTVRKNHAESLNKVGKIGLRGKTIQKHHALSSGHTQPRDQVGPCITKRGDGQTVKLVCLDCDRENFLSTQGFINHCRIAHQRDFKSHVEAANASGQFVKVNETGDLIQSYNNPEIVSDLVHPLVRNAPTGKEARDACRSLLARLADSKEMHRQGRLPDFSSVSKREGPTYPMPNSSFPSSSKSHLSELLHRKGFADNLDKMIEEFHQETDLEESSVERETHDSKSSDVVIETRTRDSHELQILSLAPLNRISMPVSVDLSSSPRAQDKSAKYINNGCDLNKRPRKMSSCFSPVTLISQDKIPTTLPCQLFSAPDYQHENNLEEGMMCCGHSPCALSPCPFNSYNAPSLVSDDGDYDEDAIESGRFENEIYVCDDAEVSIEEDMETSELQRRTDTRHKGRLPRKKSISIPDLQNQNRGEQLD